MTTPDNTGASVNNIADEQYSDAVMSSAQIDAAAAKARKRASNYEDYQVQIDSLWPPPVFMKKTLPFEQRFYLENRWYGQWKFYDDKAAQNKKRYLTLQQIIVIFSVVVPVLVGFGPSLATSWESTFGYDIRTGIDILTVLLSLMVAVAAAIEGLFSYGDNWRTYRQAAEDLTQEKFMYDVGASHYAMAPNPFAVFVERCEDIIAQQNGRWVQKTQQNQAALAAANEEILDQYRDELDDAIDTTFDAKREVTRTEQDADGTITTVHEEMSVSRQDVPAEPEPDVSEVSVAEAAAPIATTPDLPVVPDVVVPDTTVADTYVAPDITPEATVADAYVAPDEYAVADDAAVADAYVAPDDYAVADGAAVADMYVAPDDYAVADGAAVADMYVAPDDYAVADGITPENADITAEHTIVTPEMLAETSGGDDSDDYAAG